MQHVRRHDLGLSLEELSALARALRALHTDAAPLHDQSVRGGTQTDRSVLLNLEPIIQQTRTRIQAALGDYVENLPARDARHPLLGRPRDRFGFAGSWSVRLQAGGSHVPHTHPMGWISSALHVETPSLEVAGPVANGPLRFGEPPGELGLPLEAYGQVAPVPGQLVLFPSTMWHRTAPFETGERLSLAFDVIPLSD